MPRSILKKSKTASAMASDTPAARSRADRNMDTAMHHANLIQQRKDMEARILASTEALLDLPSSPSAEPSNPSPSDAVFTKESLKPFQPSDYDALIEERNINRQCGYVLCPRQNRKQDTKAKYRILKSKDTGSDVLKIVPTQSLEKWCSDECGKRALYIKVQLNEEPAWTRADSSAEDINLLDECGDVVEMDVSQELLEANDVRREDQIVERMQTLALERGHVKFGNDSRDTKQIQIQEKPPANGEASPPPAAINAGRTANVHDSIDGYIPKFANENNA